MENRYLIWSNEHQSWWKPNSLGYTTSIAFAGIYERELAMNIVEGATYSWNKIPNEVPVRIIDLPEDAQNLINIPD